MPDPPDPPPADHDPPPAPPATPSIAAVSVKLPPFWPQDPEVWFAQVEAQFATRGVANQKTKFDYVVSSLNPEFAMEVRDLLLKPPADNPYDKLKAQLIKRTAASEQRKLQQLISGEELGDRKPTQLLRRMQQLLGDKLGGGSDDFLRELFLQRLPGNVRMVLASADPSTDIEKLADMADKIIEVSTPPVVAALSPTSHTDSSEFQQLRDQVSRLADLVTSLSRETRPRRRSFSRPRPRSNTPPPPMPPEHESLCWYHAKFGDKALKCKDPCSWVQGNH